MSDDRSEELPEVPWTIKLGVGIVALAVCGFFLGKSASRPAPTEEEQKWVANLRQMDIDEATAERLAAEVRAGSKPHEETGNLGADIANYHDDIAHMAAIYWWHAREDARAAHAATWRKWAIVPGAVAAIALLLAFLGFRRRPR
jgi:hypothetical protein